MKQMPVLLVCLGLLCLAVLGLPLLMGVWLPDVINAPKRTLAEQRLADGHSFRVVQYWNRFDFYSTELHVTSPSGHSTMTTLDGDDAKSWRVPLVIDEAKRIATVTLSGGRAETVTW